MSVREITDVGASAAASSSVQKPCDAAYSMRDSGFFELEMFDWPVSAKRLEAPPRGLWCFRIA